MFNMFTATVGCIHKAMRLLSTPAVTMALSNAIAIFNIIA